MLGKNESHAEVHQSKSKTISAIDIATKRSPGYTLHYLYLQKVKMIKKENIIPIGQKIIKTH